MMHKAEQEMFQKSMNLPGWTYKDLPRMTLDIMDQFIELIGEENIRWITHATYEGVRGQPTTTRGQVMISPAGVQRGREYAERTKGEK